MKLVVVLCSLLLVGLQGVWGGKLVNYYQVGDASFVSVLDGPIKFDASSGTLTYGDTEMTEISAVEPFTDELTATDGQSDGFSATTAYQAWRFVGGVNEASTPVIFVQKWDPEGDVDVEQETITEIALQVQDYRRLAELPATNTDSVEAQILAGMAKVWAELGGEDTELLAVGLDKAEEEGGPATYSLKATFDIEKIDTKFYNKDVDQYFKNKIYAILDASKVVPTPDENADEPPLVASNEQAAPPNAPPQADGEPNADSDPPTTTPVLAEDAESRKRHHKHGHRFSETKSINYEVIISIAKVELAAPLDHIKDTITSAKKSPLALMQEDEVQNKRPHHRRSRFAHSRHANSVMGKAADQPLAGGAQISVPGSFGTMGGIMIGPVTANSYKLFGMSNWHVAGQTGTTKDHVCQPAGSPCVDLGDVAVACCDVAVQHTKGKQMDVSLIPIDANDRWNTKCSQYGSVSQSPASSVLNDITGVGAGATGDLVRKYGARTMWTTGWLEPASTRWNHQWNVHSWLMPAFSDSSPKEVAGTVPTGVTDPVPKQVSPGHETTWFANRIRAQVEPLIMTVKDPATTNFFGWGGNTFTQSQATQIFDALWAAGRISMVADQGDSGSWFTKMDGTAVALLNRAGFEERGPRNFRVLGHDWGKFVKFALAYSMTSAVSYANKLLRDDTAFGYSVDVCVESRRPKPPVDATTNHVDCSTATLTGTDCTWPYACKKNTVAAPPCVARP